MVKKLSLKMIRFELLNSFRMRSTSTIKVPKCKKNQTCQQSFDISLGQDSLFVSTPAFITCNADAQFQQSVNLHLASPSASVFLLDWYTSGRKVRNEHFINDHYF
jgi:urease accessory protein UreH